MNAVSAAQANADRRVRLVALAAVLSREGSEVMTVPIGVPRSLSEGRDVSHDVQTLGSPRSLHVMTSGKESSACDRPAVLTLNIELLDELVHAHAIEVQDLASYALVIDVRVIAAFERAKFLAQSRCASDRYAWAARRALKRRCAANSRDAMARRRWPRFARFLAARRLRPQAGSGLLASTCTALRSRGCQCERNSSCRANSPLTVLLRALRRGD